MWNGKWSNELDKLYTAYIDLFDSEPDLDMEAAGKAAFDDMSYNEFKNRIIRSISSGRQIS